MEVGIRELRLDLSRSVTRVRVARVRAGAEVSVPDRGRPVARPAPIDSAEQRAEEVYDAWCGRAWSSRAVGGAGAPELPPLIPREGDGPLVSEMVLENRR